jgi:hypothetical protein
MYELGVRGYCRGNTYGTIVGITLQSTITTAVEAAVYSSGRGKVTVSATLENNQKEACVRARKSQGENVARYQSWGEEKMRTHIRPDFQLSGTENWVEV